MKDFKNNPEIVQNIEHFIDDGSEIKISLIVSPWNVAHLTVRSVETWCKQSLPSKMWELIVISDNSDDNVYASIQHAIGKINVRFISLKHSWGMRGNCVSYNTGFAWSRGDIIAETTGETMFTHDIMLKLYEPHLKHERAFVAVKTFNLTHELQLKIDSVAWREDVSNIISLEGFFNDWTLNNFKTMHFGTHQTCSIKKKVFYEIFPNGYFLYCDYGSEDAKFCGMRPQFGVKDITIYQPMAFHQWHISWQWHMSKGKSPMTNKFAHTLSNYMNDESGEIPATGTSQIWDGGSREQLSQAEIDDYAKWDDIIRATGFKMY